MTSSPAIATSYTASSSMSIASFWLDVFIHVMLFYSTADIISLIGMVLLVAGTFAKELGYAIP